MTTIPPLETIETYPYAIIDLSKQPLMKTLIVASYKIVVIITDSGTNSATLDSIKIVATYVFITHLVQLKTKNLEVTAEEFFCSEKSPIAQDTSAPDILKAYLLFKEESHPFAILEAIFDMPQAKIRNQVELIEMKERIRDLIKRGLIPSPEAALDIVCPGM